MVNLYTSVRMCIHKSDTSGLLRWTTRDIFVHIMACQAHPMYIVYVLYLIFYQKFITTVGSNLICAFLSTFVNEFLCINMSCLVHRSLPAGNGNLDRMVNQAGN